MIMPKNQFDKFIKSKSNAAKKEEFRQAKRTIKKEIAEGMARTRARKAAEAAAKKAARDAPRPEGLAKGAPVRAKAAPATAAPAQAKPATGTTVKPGKPGAPQMPLNKFLSHSGVSSRREAAEIIKEGQVKVNGQVVIEPGFKVSEADDVRLNGKKLKPTGELVYLLLNKPKDYITTSSDPEGRKTVLDLVRKATTERIFPIGRLDRNTTGVLLLTNDGELAQKLSHPSYEIKKIYEVRLDKELTKKDFETIQGGVTLEDGNIKPDALAYADSKDKSVIGIEIHSGKNRIVRRIFEHLGYSVQNLDRVMYAGLTKKNVDRGRWRFLSEKEVRVLKYLNTSFTRKKPKA
jgi:23S rRNA pseudouridine2605 synthase